MTPNTLNENVFLQITFLKILVIFLQTALSHFAFPHMRMSARRHRFAQKLSSDVGPDSRTNILQFL